MLFSLSLPYSSRNVSCAKKARGYTGCLGAQGELYASLFFLLPFIATKSLFFASLFFSTCEAHPCSINLQKRVSPTSPTGSGGFFGSRSPRNVSGSSPFGKSPRSSPSPPQSSSPRPGALVPSVALNEVARLARAVKDKQNGPLTDDALLAGWLHIQEGKEWVPRFFQLRSGSLTSFGCSSQRLVTVSDKTTTKHQAMPESSSRWLRSDVNTLVTIQDPSVYKLASPSLLCTSAQSRVIEQLFESSLPNANVRLIICFRSDISGGAPVQVLVRISAKHLYIFDLEDALEYTLMGLSLQPTDEPVCEAFPFGLRVSSAVSDQMFVPLNNLLLAAQTPIIILQWMGALQTADLDPPPQPKPARQNLASTGTRGTRSTSGALLGQLVSDAVGKPGKGSFSGVAEFSVESNAEKKEALESHISALEHEPDHPKPLREAILLPDYQSCLAEFCKTIFTEENVNFCIEVERFRSSRDARAKQSMARTISAEYISYSGKSVVNINSATRKRVEDILSAGVPVPPNVFDNAFDEVLQLIETDSWPKFLSKLNDVRAEAMMNEGEHSWDSGDSSSYEERERKSGAESTWNDFGMKNEDTDNSDVDKIRQEVAKSVYFDPKEEPPTLKFLLAKKDTRQLLQRFAKTLLAEENVMFWESVQRFKATDSLDERKKHLQVLFADFIPSGSATMVNIAGSERTRLMKLFAAQGESLASSKELFDPALVECIKVMELDLYPKFMNLVKDVNPQSSKKEAARARAPPLWEILNDANELDSLLVFAAGNNQQDDILFWCLVQRFRTEPDADTRNKMGSFIMQNYVSSNAPRMIRVDKSKKGACQDRFLAMWAKKETLPGDLYDALWRDVQSSMNKHLHPAYDKYVRKPKNKGVQLLRSTPGNMLEQELSEAMKEDELNRKDSKWVAIKASAGEGTGPPEQKRSLLGGTRRKAKGSYE